jgi:23S rRNA (adenine-N6)-dimethyltransferase
MKRRVSHSQNFIKSRALVEKLLALPEVELRSDDLLVEIGPGKGIISEALASMIKNKGRLILVELDKKYCKILSEKFVGNQNIEVLNKNFIDFDLPKKSFKVFSNIPFNYTSDILTKLLDPLNAMSSAYLIMQKQALERWSKGSLKALQNYPFFSFSTLYKFSKKDFIPSPSVDCVLAKIIRREKYLIPRNQRELYNDFLASIAKVKVGQGIWKQLFSDRQLTFMYKNYGLIKGKGIYSQQAGVIINVYYSFTKRVSDRQKELIKGTMSKLVSDQGKLDKAYRTR